MAMPIEKRINQLGRHIVEVLARDLQSDAMKLSEAKAIADHYLSKICFATTDAEIDRLLSSLHAAHPRLERVFRSDKLWQMRAKNEQE